MLRAPSAVALATLLVGGVISCASQTFDARGLAFGLASNCCFAARSIYVSMLQDRLKRERATGPPVRGVTGVPSSSSSPLPPHATAARYELSSSTVFFYQHLLGLLLMLPCSLFEDARCGAKITLPATSHYATQSVLGFYAYNQLSLVALLMLHPLAHSVANSCRRCVTILSAAIVFGTFVTPLSSTGIGLVIGGAITYALSEGSFLPASCDGSRGREVRPEERDEEDEEVERLAGPTPSDGSDER
jgi:drug/metabolite transporter (DMT)-like permease